MEFPPVQTLLLPVIDTFVGVTQVISGVQVENSDEFGTGLEPAWVAITITLDFVTTFPTLDGEAKSNSHINNPLEEAVAAAVTLVT